MNVDESLAFLISRRSIRKFKRQKVPAGLIDQLLQVGCYAPSAHDSQPWRFAVIRNTELIISLADALNAKLRADLQQEGLPQEDIDIQAIRRRERLTRAPVLILLALSRETLAQYPDQPRRQAELLMGVQSVALAGQNILLAAHALGLGACWLGAPLFAQEVVQEYLHLPADWEPQAFIALGYPEETPEQPFRAYKDKTIYFE
jgi:coenzyme F420-0:L-glutamate ligase / coenzyme F420-1:gamma-L-glutamate ligase